MRTSRTMRPCRALAALLLAALAVGGCNEHPVTRVLVAPTVIGISIPIPPPSLQAAPMQAVDIAGEGDELVPDSAVYLFEHRSDRGYFILADDAGDFVFTAVPIDLTDNCIQIWYAEPGPEGAESAYGSYVLSIGDDDQSVLTTEVEDCP